MRLIKIILTTIILGLIIIPVINYSYNKTLWEDKTDCMIQYVNKYYPNWCTYIIEWEFRHIDKCWIENELMIENHKVNWCMMWFNVEWLFNTPYCYITLGLEYFNN